MTDVARVVLVLAAAALLPARAGAQGELAPSWKTAFPTNSTLQQVRSLEAKEEAYRVLSNGKPVGWVFATDRVKPLVKGYGGEIGMQVCLSLDGTVLALQVVRQRETPHYFGRIGKPFYDALVGRRVGDGAEGLDTVTGATVSSRAVLRDVLDSARRVMERDRMAAAVAGAGG